MIIVRIGTVLLATLLIMSVAAALSPADITTWSDPGWVVAGNATPTQIWVSVTNTSCPGNGCNHVHVTATVVDPSMGTITPSSIDTGPNGTIDQPFLFTPETTSGNAAILINTTPNQPPLDPPAEMTYYQKIDHSTPVAYQSFDYSQSVPINTTSDIRIQLKDAYGNTVDSRREESELRGAETITFADSGIGDGGFWDGTGYVPTYTASVNSTGYFAARYKVPSSAGDSILQVVAPDSVTPSTLYITITSFATTPAAISSVVNPVNGVTYADGSSTFSILYTVTDPFGNPVPYIAFWQTTSLGESYRFVTNDQGQAVTTYGPMVSVGTVTVTATIDGYSSIRTTDTLEFIHTAPSMWELTASPQTLASREVNPAITADVRVKVIDPLGNPVSNETATFSITNTTNTTRLVAPPSLDNATSGSVTATTDADGFAIATFRPGQFPSFGDAGFNETALGTATVQAMWNGETKTISLDFRNYPYLRVVTDVNPQTVQVNGTVDVSIQVIGDGWALGSKPIDVVLVTDRSGSMLEDQPDDRMVPVMKASKDFVAVMDVSPSQDHIGLISFGTNGWAKVAPTQSTTQRCRWQWQGGRLVNVCTNATSWDWSNIYGGQTTSDLANPGWWWVGTDSSYDCTPSSYSNTSVHQLYVNAHYPANPKQYTDYAFIEQQLSSSVGTISTSIDRMVPSGGTPMRYAIYRAIRDSILPYGRTSAVRAIILLSDGDYNWFGDPLARGTGSDACNPTNYGDLTSSYCKFSDLGGNQNLSSYATSNAVRIYAIGYASDMSAGGRTTLRTLAESTGGKYYDGSAANISTIYKSIAGDLRTAAGVNTAVNLSFQNLEVSYDNLTSLVPGRDIFDYQYVDGISTRITSWNSTANPLLGNVPPYPYTLNQTSAWLEDPLELNFYVGNISINQVWQVTFRLIVKAPGSISIFGPESQVSFGDGVATYSLTMPKTFITAIANLTPQSPAQAVVDIRDLNCTNYHGLGSITELMNLAWTLNYTGTKTVKQDVFYEFSRDGQIWDGNWVKFTSILTDAGPIPDTTFVATLDVRDVRGFFKIKVTGREQVPGGAYDEATYGPLEIRAPIGVIKIT